MMRFDPFREIEELSQRMDRVFGATTNTPARFAPNVDIHEDDQGLEIGLDLPGVDPANIQVEAENNTLTVQAERKYDRSEGRTAHRVERAYGTFSRTFSVPAKYDLSKLEATYTNGTLSLRLPRSEASLKRTIEVKAVTNVSKPAIEAAATNQA
ncbi:Hsp20/alpha crystallin family protein [Deinococcus maricopensis]|uniref:Heat shock protein Hsp20 n=1 Tax=Deinococcus maricopensis (strain DSM 21211 / LMG 22137 / NRRL B-23946 / LB-34) TaxID=709986 RepID=E8U9C9_DEIML|nr:Hsp20/alpha crystallin family protein [Deinococcus maricopensis]ADV67668.1 heat shock protein Hsp20 [Deinococcus maricopensis DSM 21211]